MRRTLDADFHMLAAETGGGNTQLHAALAAGDEPLVEVRLSAGLAADAPEARGITPLMAASALIAEAGRGR